MNLLGREPLEDEKCVVYLMFRKNTILREARKLYLRSVCSYGFPAKLIESNIFPKFSPHGILCAQVVLFHMRITDTAERFPFMEIQLDT